MIAPPPTPNSALNAPAAVAIAASRTSLGDIARILRTVSATTAETLAEGLRPHTDDPDRGAILCDIDGVLAPIVRRADEARVPSEIARLLGRLARRYGLVAWVSGRPAAEPRRLVGVALAHLASAASAMRTRLIALLGHDVGATKPEGERLDLHIAGVAFLATCERRLWRDLHTGERRANGDYGAEEEEPWRVREARLAASLHASLTEGEPLIDTNACSQTVGMAVKA